jgi:hypothetical protein
LNKICKGILLPLDKHILEFALIQLNEEKNKVDAHIAEVNAQLKRKFSGGPKTKKLAKAKVGSKVKVRKSLKGKSNTAVKDLWARAVAGGFNNLKAFKASLG